MPKIDVAPTTSEPTKRWVEVPQKDLFEFPFPTIRINFMEFGPGKHYVENDTADWIEERIRIKQEADKRIMQRSPDLLATTTMNKFGSGRGGQFVNPDIVK